MNTNPTLLFLKATGERAVGAFSGTMVTFLTAAGTDLHKLDWSVSLGVSGGAALASVLASFAKWKVGPDGPGLTEKTVAGDVDSR
jgi:glutaredoxin-related protein